MAQLNVFKLGAKIFLNDLVQTTHGLNLET